MHRKDKSRGSNRPSTSESERRLLVDSFDSDAGPTALEGLSEVYMHYRNSLVSLRSIVDNVRAGSLSFLPLTLSD